MANATLIAIGVNKTAVALFDKKFVSTAVAKKNADKITAGDWPS